MERRVSVERGNKRNTWALFSMEEPPGGVLEKAARGRGENFTKEKMERLQEGAATLLSR